jgi:hypothetical protein
MNAAAKKKASDFLTYKGHPLMRKDNFILLRQT